MLKTIKIDEEVIDMLKQLKIDMKESSYSNVIKILAETFRSDND